MLLQVLSDVPEAPPFSACSTGNLDDLLLCDVWTKRLVVFTQLETIRLGTASFLLGVSEQLKSFLDLPEVLSRFDNLRFVSGPKLLVRGTEIGLRGSRNSFVVENPQFRHDARKRTTTRNSSLRQLRHRHDPGSAYRRWEKEQKSAASAKAKLGAQS